MRNDIEAMLGPKYTTKSYYYLWAGSWMITCPIICFVIIFYICSINYLVSLKFNIFAFKGLTVLALRQVKNLQVADYVFPDWTLFAGELMEASVLLAMFLVGLYHIIKAMLDKNKVNIFGFLLLLTYV